MQVEGPSVPRPASRAARHRAGHDVGRRRSCLRRPRWRSTRARPVGSPGRRLQRRTRARAPAPSVPPAANRLDGGGAARLEWGHAAPRPRRHPLPRPARRDGGARPRARRRDLHPRRLRRPAGGRPRAARRPRRPRRPAAALDGWAPELVVDTSCQTRAAARNAAAVLADVRGYAFVSSLNAYRELAARPVGPEDGEPTWTTDDDEYGPNKAFAERELGGGRGRAVPHRAGRPDHRPVRPDPPARLVAGPHRAGAAASSSPSPGPADRRRGRPRPGRLAGRDGRAGPVRRGQRDRADRDDDAGRPARRCAAR